MSTLLTLAILLITLTTLSVNSKKCRDRSVCLSFDTCTDSDAILRAGHTCNGFPWYNGWAPISSAKWSSEDERYECLQRSGDVCIEWSTREDSKNEYEVGIAECTQYTSTYCLVWNVIQNEVRYCSGWSDGDYIQLIDGSRVQEECCTTSCDDYGCWDVCNRRQIGVEITDCECRETITTSGGTETCGYWYCREYKQNSALPAEDEYYNCTETDAKQCVHWMGFVESTQEFELSDCGCTSFTAGNCRLWECYEKEMKYYDPDLSWIAFGIVWGGAWWIGGLCVAYLPNWGVCGTVLWLIGSFVLCFCIAIFPALFRGGIITFIVTMIFFIVVWFVFELILLLTFKKRSLFYACGSGGCGCGCFAGLFKALKPSKKPTRPTKPVATREEMDEVEMAERNYEEDFGH